MSKAAELAALIGSQTALSNRNKIINGNFQIWQRGTSQTSVGYGSADRWYYNPSGATGTASRQSFTDGQTAVPGNPKYYMNLDITTGNDNAGWNYRIEGTHEFANDVYTLSFWAKSDTARELKVTSQSHDLSADVFFNNTTSPTTFTPTSSWQKFTFKVTHGNMNTLGSFASGDYTRLQIFQEDTSTAAWELDLAQVQFEKGEVATPFEHRSDADELQRCQRYYHRLDSANGNGNYYRYNTQRNTSSTGTAGTYHMPVLMRVTPSVSTTGTASNYAITHVGGNTACSSTPSFGGDGAGPDLVNLEVNVASGLTSGQASQLMSNNNKTSFIGFDAEL